MKAKLRGTTGLPFEVREVSCHTYEEFTGKEAIPFIQYYVDEEGNFYEDTDLDFNLDPPQPEATISGWIVRDKQNITSILAHRGSKLYLCQEKPKRIDSMGIWDKDSEYYRIPDDLFPNITFESDPLEVKITIKSKKK